MGRLHSILAALALATMPVVGAAGVWALWPVHAAAIGASQRLNGVLDGVNGTLVNINRPCKGPAGPDACGTLAQINKTSIAAGDMVNQSRIQLAQTGELVRATTAQMSSIGAHVASTVDALGDTARAATGAIDQAHQDLAAAEPGLAAVKPLLEASTKTVADVDAVTPNLGRLMKASAEGMEQTSGIAVDVHKMTTHLEKDVDSPVPWWKKLFPLAGDATAILNCFRGGGCR